MEYTKYIPYTRNLFDITTTTDKEIQLWQEITMLRHIKPGGIYGKIVTAPYLDQAKIYYLDARNSHWKSAGLLYYYSFLNLVKAFIVSKRAVSGSLIKSTNIYHGLKANPQKPSRLVDFEIEIYPPVFRNSKNVFAIFYERLTNKSWPFAEVLSLRIGDVLSYCDEISHELQLFYSIPRATTPIQSMIRIHSNQVWFELAVLTNYIPVIRECFGERIFQVLERHEFSNLDKRIWLEAYDRNPISFINNSMVKIDRRAFNADSRSQVISTFLLELSEHLKDNLITHPVNDHTGQSHWIFSPHFSIRGTTLKWHPLLSTYLFAFVLSTVLRYQPHILNMENQNSFFAEAWCNQSPIMFIRHFLIALTNPSIRTN